MSDNSQPIRSPDDPKFREDWEAFVNEFAHESDRASALLGAAYLDEILGELIESFLVDDETTRSLLSSNRPYAPLGTFSSRILAAFCLGLIDRVQYKDLSSIRRIRNQFAHQLQGLSFQDESIEKECNKLVAYRMTSFNLDAEGRFLCTVLVLSVDIDAQRRNFLPQRRTIPDFYGFLEE